MLFIVFSWKGKVGYTGLTNAEKCRLYRQKNGEKYREADALQNRIWRENLWRILQHMQNLRNTIDPKTIF